jgi:hypothetical protein
MSQIYNADPKSQRVTSDADASVNQIVQQSQPPKQPGGFRRFLGAAVGIAGNVFAPGIGGVLGNIIGGGIGGSNSATDPNQFLRLQQQVDAQSEAFQTVSAVLKSKHDSAMAAINNMKG